MRDAPQSPVRKQSLLGQRLVSMGLLEPAELRQVLAFQESLSPDEPVRRLGSLLVQSGRLSMRQLADALGEQRQVMPSSGVTSQVPKSLHHVLPLALLHEVGAAPLCLLGRTLAVAMVDAHDSRLVARLQAETHYTIRPMQAPQLQVCQLLASIPAPERPSSMSGLSARGSRPSPASPRPSPASPRPSPASSRPSPASSRPSPASSRPSPASSRPAGRAAAVPGRRALKGRTTIVSVVVLAAAIAVVLAAAGLQLKLRHGSPGAAESAGAPPVPR